MEFLETHNGDDIKSVWKNDNDISMETEKEKSNDDESKDDEFKESKDKEKEEKSKEDEKLANKVISDLEVCTILRLSL